MAAATEKPVINPTCCSPWIPGRGVTSPEEVTTSLPPHTTAATPAWTPVVPKLEGNLLRTYSYNINENKRRIQELQQMLAAREKNKNAPCIPKEQTLD
ncbi:unnamed protein product [Ranitomeya imitator]|uniref:Uncharacterized protein n=1 Tax=Ranitomeya imitator TaxID=111125 RepID=A0ABN9M3M1_9NEOB|nr:unnamed protein product [Ranitomeya imitator]